MVPNLAVGQLAYYDTFNGAIPCKVLHITGQSNQPISSVDVKFKLTAARGAWKKGEIITCSSLWVFPRKARHQRNGVYRIGHYTVGLHETTEPGQNASPLATTK